MLGIFFKKKSLGVVSEETLKLFQEKEEYEKALFKRMAAFLIVQMEEAKKTTHEHFSFQKELLKNKHEAAWNSAYDELGLNPDQNYRVDKETGEIKLD